MTLSKGGRDTRTLRKVQLFVLMLLLCSFAWSQDLTKKPTPAEVTPQPATDSLGRSTPRGTVLGFLSAARKDDLEVAVLFLNTPLHGTKAAALARQLYAILNRYLPTPINEISDKPEGSNRDPLRPDEEIVGTITAPEGEFEVVLERVDRGKVGKIWLFSQKMLTVMPQFSRASEIHTAETHLPEFLVTTRLLTIPLFQWLAVFVGIPFVYFLTGLLNRLVNWTVGKLRQRLRPTGDASNPQVLSTPIRLLLLALVIRWLLSMVELSFFARQFWSTLSLFIALIGCICLLLRLNGHVERYLSRSRHTSMGSVLRLFRRLIDAIILFAGLIFTLNYFGINVTTALAGVGIGGIAIALAAQKTLENVIAGVSLIFDRVVHIGDVMNLGEVQGTIEQVGLRSTRLRTVDRTLVSMPNGQIANIKLETLSARDKFLFHPVVGLRHDTAPYQLRLIVDQVRDLLLRHATIDRASVRVRFIRFGPSSLDVDVFGYVFAQDWDNFLRIQEELLFGIMDVVQNAGAEMAFPSRWCAGVAFKEG
jgi:MscS family membrane protein